MKPPRAWWSQTWKQVASWNTKASKQEVTKIVSRIWRELPSAMKESLVLGSRTIKLTELPCPRCRAMNPVTKTNMPIKCRKCGKGLISIRVKRR